MEHLHHPRRSERHHRSILERFFGWGLVGLGAATMLTVTTAGYTDVGLLPGHHDVAYFFAGVVIAGAGTWWLGLFDGDDAPDSGPYPDGRE